MAYRRGINRPEIMSLTREAVIRLTGLPASSVFFSDYAVDTAACPRPCVSMTLMPFETEQREGSIFHHPSLEYWRFIVTSSANATYSVTIDGTTYSHAAVGQTAAQIRSSLLAVVNGGAHPNFVAVSAGTASIDVESRVSGRLLVCSSSAGVSTSRLRGDQLEVTVRAVEMRLQIECVGAFSNPPDVSLTGVDIAERLQHALLSQQDTAAMRDANHHITRVRTTDARRITAGQEETIGVIDAILNTTSIHITSTGATTSIPASFEEAS